MWFLIPVFLVGGVVVWAIARHEGAPTANALEARYQAALTDIALQGHLSPTELAQLSRDLQQGGESQRSANIDTLLAQGAGTNEKTPIMTRVSAAAGTHDGAVMMALVGQLQAAQPPGWAPIAQQLTTLARTAAVHPQAAAA